MTVQKFIGAVIVGLMLVLFGASVLQVSSVSAQQDQAAAASPETIRQALEQQVGKRAKLWLVSGENVEGKVVEVNDKVVIIHELTGMEYFGATVRLEQVAAVISRTATQ